MTTPAALRDIDRLATGGLREAAAGSRRLLTARLQRLLDAEVRS
jgi:hypothetical protein